MKLSPPLLIPTILTSSFAEFAEQAKQVANLVPYIQIDVMDGQFVDNRSFSDIEKINELHIETPWELHLMVNSPLAEMQRWSEIKNVWRAIFPIESSDNPKDCIAYARSKCWQVGIMLKADTPLAAIEPYYDQIDVVLFMTVEPGRQGNPFLPHVGEKIKNFTALPKRPLCAVDGGVNAKTIPLIKSWGVEIFNVGSALMKAKNIPNAYSELKKILES